MVIICSAPGCLAKKNNSTSKTSVQFHRFPLRKPDLLAKWVKAMKCSGFKPTATSYLCSAHFINSDYDLKSPNATKQLKPNAVPSHFEKRKPGRKKKVNDYQIAEEEEEEGGGGGEVNSNAEYMKMNEQREEEYLQDETEEKIETNLADIIGDRHKGTLQVLIVGEDGKITNSEYIFKKEMIEKKNFKVEPEEYFEDDMADDENISLEKKNDNENKVKDIERGLRNTSDYYNMTLKSERNNLDKLTLNKLKQLNFKYKKLKKENDELKILLKLLVLKRGRGKKNLKELLEDYEKYEYEEVKIKVKEENLFVEN